MHTMLESQTILEKNIGYKINNFISEALVRCHDECSVSFRCRPDNAAMYRHAIEGCIVNGHWEKNHEIVEFYEDTKNSKNINGFELRLWW